MLIWWIETFHAVWPWLAFGFLTVFNLIIAYNLRSHLFLPGWAASVEPILSMVSANAIVLIGVFEPAWATRELVWTLSGFLMLSVLQYAFYFYRIEGAQGKKLNVSTYLGEVWWISCVHGGGFLSAWWWLSFAAPAS